MRQALAALLLVLFFAIKSRRTDAIRVGVLVHGCNTHRTEEEWVSIAWGDESSGQSGRITAALATIDKLVRTGDELFVVWGSGVRSAAYTDLDPVLEGAFTLRLLEAKMRCMEERSKIKCLEHLSGSELRALATRVVACSSSQITSTNTRTEIDDALKFFRAHNCHVVALVSSASHAPRCLRDASAALAGLYDDNPRPILIVAPSETLYACASHDDTHILEPPHILPSSSQRVPFGTRHPHHTAAWHFNAVIGKLLRISPNEALNSALDKVISEHEQK